jgi:hypothetical protein
MTQIIKVTPGYVKNLIAEEREILLRHDRWKKILIAEGYRMHSEGYSSNQINESLWQMAKAFGLKFWQSIKHDIADWALEKLGIIDPQGFMGLLIKNIFEEMDIFDLPKYFGDEGCGNVISLVTGALIETPLEGPVDGFMDGLGVNPQSRIYITLREVVMSGVAQGPIADAISDFIEEWVCGVEVSEIVDALTNKGTEIPQIAAAE